MDRSPPGSSVHGILQARILEWVAICSSKRSSPPGINSCFSHLLHWQADSVSLEPPGTRLCSTVVNKYSGVQQSESWFCHLLAKRFGKNHLSLVSLSLSNWCQPTCELASIRAHFTQDYCENQGRHRVLHIVWHIVGAAISGIFCWYYGLCKPFHYCQCTYSVVPQVFIISLG